MSYPEGAPNLLEIADLTPRDFLEFPEIQGLLFL